MNNLISYSLHVTKFYEDHNYYLSGFYFKFYYFILFYLFILFYFFFFFFFLKVDKILPLAKF
jgi:hypothetical protein